MRRAFESLKAMLSRSVGITSDDFITDVLNMMRSAGVVNCSDSSDWKSCFEEVGADEFAEFVSNHFLTTFAIIALRARGHIVVTPNPVPTIMLASTAGFVLLARDLGSNECFAIINTPAARRLLRTRPCDFAIEF